MKIILIPLILVACGYGAYTHLEEQEKRIAEAESAKRKTEAEKAEYLRSVEALNQKVSESTAKFEEAKKRRSDELAAEMTRDFEQEQAGLENELAAVRDRLSGLRDGMNLQKLAGAKAELKQLAEAKAELNQLSAAQQKASETHERLLKYVAAEQAAIQSGSSKSPSPSSGRITVY